MSDTKSLLKAILEHPEDVLERLSVLREIVAVRIDATESARETASLARVMLDIEAAMRSHVGAPAATPVDELLAKRKARGAK